MSANEEKISFSLTEAVWFKQGMAVYDIRSLSLEPFVHIEEKEDSVFIEGHLQLYGEYEPNLTDDFEAERDSLRDMTGERTIQEVTVGQNGIWTLKHQFPIDVNIPRERVANLEDLSIHIQMFDYDLLNERCLEIQADIEIAGMREKDCADPELEPVREIIEEDDIPIYKTVEPQIYAEMNMRETEEVILEQVCEPTEIAEEPSNQASPVMEIPLYIQPMSSDKRTEVNIPDYVTETKVPQEVRENSEMECFTDIPVPSQPQEPNTVRPVLFEELPEESATNEVQDIEETIPIQTEWFATEHVTNASLEQRESLPEGNESLGENATEWFDEEIPVLSDIEKRLLEMEKDLEVKDAYTEIQKPSQPAIFHFQSMQENTVTDENLTERIDLSQLFSDHFVDEPSISNGAMLDEVSTSRTSPEDISLRKEQQSENAMQVEKYNLADGPKKVTVEETEEIMIQEDSIVQKNLMEKDVLQQAPSIQEENALYLAKLFQSKEENRTQMKIYFAQKGDSVQSLAIRFNVPIHHIHKFNHLDDDELQVGDAIYIPTKSR